MNPETREYSSEISIDTYNDSYRADLVAGISDLQDFERNITDTRRPGHEVAEDYLKEILEKTEKQSGAVFVAKYENRVIGFIGCFVRNEDSITETPESNIYGYISDAYVIPEFRNKGVFKKLNDKAEEHLSRFENVKLIRIFVLAENKQALRAYEKNGYKPEEIRLIKKLEKNKNE